MRHILFIYILVSTIFLSADSQTLTFKVFSTYPEENYDGDENISKIADGNPESKYLSRHNFSSIFFKADYLIKIDSISIISGNDCPQRDPSEIVVSGSFNGDNYDLIQKFTELSWEERLEVKNLNLENSVYYRYYKFDTKNTGIDEYGSDFLQISEIIPYGDKLGTELPVASISIQKSIVEKNELLKIINKSKNYNKIDIDIPQSDFTLLINDTLFAHFNSPCQNQISTRVERKDYYDFDGSLNEYKVVDSLSNWSGFIKPEIKFYSDNLNKTGTELYNQIVRNPQEYISNVSELVARMIFNNSFEIDNPIRLLYYDVVSGMEPGIPSYLSGAGAVTGIKFSNDHVERAWNITKDIDKVESEIYGVLFHEQIHGYQLNPQGAGEYDGKSEKWAFIEGLADAVRIRSGFHQSSKPYNSDKKWLSGYTGTGYFYNWICNNYDSDFLIKINLSTKEINPWSHKQAIEQIIGKDIDFLWNEYANSIGKIEKPIVEISVDKNNITSGETVTYSAISQNSDSYYWIFDGGVPSTSNSSAVSVKYSKPGKYNAVLVGHNKSTEGPGIVIKRAIVEVTGDYKTEEIITDTLKISFNENHENTLFSKVKTSFEILDSKNDTIFISNKPDTLISFPELNKGIYTFKINNKDYSILIK
ncbi:MAG: hypothetical protein JXR48_06400 [Candidatus Delongbacteria bacterium]|nr:hypothetical protein [Candidatus Delongbacteria bacterium]MBN2834581.1 hypothetical protein [Candidatus Delongbacteria bacterium]